MQLEALTRPIVGIENRTAQEVFDIMADRIRHATPSPEPTEAEVEAAAKAMVVSRGLQWSTITQTAQVIWLNDARLALLAASRSRPAEAKAGMVKALEWVTVEAEHRAITVCGMYAISPKGNKLTLTGMPGDMLGRFGSMAAAKAAAQADFEQRILSALEPVAEAKAEPVATHRHKKRGTEYVLLGIGKMQAEGWFRKVPGPGVFASDHTVDMREVAIYRSVDDGSLWVRPREEFEDGRFERKDLSHA